jgi:hypothetical protein
LGWRVSGVSGEASARLGSAPFERLVIGDIVPVGSDVRTGRGSVVFLSRRGDRIVIQPASELHIAEPKSGGLLTEFFQSFGNVFYDVEPRSSRSFGVKAPYMAAVVKGTRFLVTVKRDTNSVRVDEGRVLVASAGGESSVMVAAGGLATVRRSGNGSIQLSNSMIPPVLQLAPLSPIGTTTTVNAVDGVTEGASGTVGTTATGATQTSSGVLSAVGATAKGAVSAVGGVVGGAARAVGGAVGAVGGAVGGAAGAVGGAVGGVADAAGGVVGGAADAAGGVVGGVADTAGNVVGGIGQAAGGVVAGAGKAVGGLLGRR